MSDNPSPVRIQLSRAKGWRMPPNTVKVDRSTKWGNPWKIGDNSNRLGRAVETAQEAVDWYRAHLVSHEFVRISLGGKNLACWCGIINPRDCSYTPCHADVLISIANDISMEEVIRENTRWAERQTLR